MTSGKRNIIIVAALVLLLSISGLHMAIFKPSAKRYKDAVAQFNREASQLQAMKNANPDELKKYMSETEELVTEISRGITQLDIEQPIEFLKLDASEVTLESPPPNASQVELDTLKHNKALEINAERREAQMKMLLDEIEELRVKRNSRVPVNTFLSNSGWALVGELRPELKTGGQLWDLIQVLAEEKEVLNYYNKDSDQYNKRYEYYLLKLRQIGLPEESIETLYKYGDSVVLIHKIAYANLIMKRIPETQPIVILTQALNRELLYKWQSIDLNFEPVTNLEENELYFMYEQLKALNFLLEEAGTAQIKEISMVELRGYGYLRKQPGMGSPDLTTMDPNNWGDDQVENAGLDSAAGAGDKKSAAGTGDALRDELMRLYAEGLFEEAAILEEEMYNYSDAQPGTPRRGSRAARKRAATEERKKFDESKTERKEDDIGYALPIKLTFRSSYKDAMKFMYEVLRKKPMAELERVFITSLSKQNPQFTDVEVTVTFVFVPKLFETLDNVRSVLEGIEAQLDSQPPQEVTSANTVE